MKSTRAALALTGLVGTFAVAMPSAEAAYSASAGGWTEIIACPTSSFTGLWGHSSSEWGDASPSLVWKDSGVGWETYANTGDSSIDCGSWMNGSVVGGATYNPGSPSLPQGVDPLINNYWYDYDVPASWTDPDDCGHQHTSVYVWGWRYHGSSWSFEFVEANSTSAYWNSSTGRCQMRAGDHPDYGGHSILGYLAFGDLSIQINNSPYAVIYTKSQATSHRSAGCGQHGCFHRVMTMVSY